MRDFITKLAKPIITLILAIAAIVFAGLYEILCVSISKNYTSIGIIVCFVLLLFRRNYSSCQTSPGPDTV